MTKIVKCIDGVNQSSVFKWTFHNTSNGYLSCMLFSCSLLAIGKTAHMLEYWIVNYRIWWFYALILHNFHSAYNVSSLPLITKILLSQLVKVFCNSGYQPRCNVTSSLLLEGKTAMSSYYNLDISIAMDKSERDRDRDRGRIQRYNLP